MDLILIIESSTEICSVSILKNARSLAPGGEPLAQPGAAGGGRGDGPIHRDRRGALAQLHADARIRARGKLHRDEGAHWLRGRHP